MSQLNSDQFRPWLHQEFVLSASGATVNAQLLQVNDLCHGSECSGGEQFSVLWRASAEVCPAQGTFDVSHPKFGQQTLFLVALGRDAHGTLLEAVFT